MKTVAERRGGGAVVIVGATVLYSAIQFEYVNLGYLTCAFDFLTVILLKFTI